jgi:hypothetical protein
MIPRAGNESNDEGDSGLYGVSLVLRSHTSASQLATTKAELVYDENDTDTDPTESFSSPIMGETAAMEGHPGLLKVRVAKDSPMFNQRMAERTWTERVALEATTEDSPMVLVLALVSQRNVVVAMRETLNKLVHEFATKSSRDALVNILGNFGHSDVEHDSLRLLLKPFLRHAELPWLERPIGSQKHAFEQMAGKHLLQSLPPIALALLYVTVLLEQKVVFSSSRRGVLLSASVALSKLLGPLNWCHLSLPVVPTALAADLLQYPAPFILGMHSEDPGMMELIRNLPSDVTLVDLDVGRVILAPAFAQDCDLGRRNKGEETLRTLRNQTLYLAQSLGILFGNAMDPETWLCDRPLAPGASDQPFDRLSAVCHDFLEELLAGVGSCCYWLEEEGTETTSEPTVWFDEDRFFQIKNHRESYGFEPLFAEKSRSSKLALSLEQFDLVLEVFLRCQSMNVFLGTRARDEMAFGL